MSHSCDRWRCRGRVRVLRTQGQASTPLASPVRMPAEPRPVTLRKSLVVIALGLIAIATLTPLGGDHARRLSLCVGCGDFALADALVNIALFVPLGCAFAFRGLRTHRALAWIVLASITVETLQYVIVRGRTASVADVMANTMGGALGMAIPGAWKWVLASAKHAGAATVAYGLMIAGLAAAALALQVMHPPPSVHWSSARVVRRGFVPFSGSVRVVRVDGTPSSERESHPVAPSDSVLLEVVLMAGQPPEGLAEVLQFWGPAEREGGRAWYWVDQYGRDVRVHVRTGADALRLRGNTSWVFGAMPAVPGDTVSLRIGLRRFEYGIAVRHGASITRKSGAVSLGDEWRLLVPFERQRERWSGTLTALWVAALLLPLGLFARLHSTKSLVAAGCLAAIYLAVLPIMAGCAALPLAGWCGAVVGYVMGAVLS
jgi:hypothetical protein